MPERHQWCHSGVFAPFYSVSIAQFGQVNVFSLFETGDIDPKRNPTGRLHVTS